MPKFGQGTFLEKELYHKVFTALSQKDLEELAKDILENDVLKRLRKESYQCF